MPYLIAFLAGALVFAVLDAVFITQIALPAYEATVPHLMAEDVNWPAAILFYVGYVAGVIWLVVRPARLHGWGWGMVLGQAAVLGLVGYGTFALTSMAVLEGWSWELVLTDTLWGAVASVAIAVSGLLAARRFG
ncbi:MAG: DUF2177 family protein [Pseudomonadota bacterium]